MSCIRQEWATFPWPHDQGQEIIETDVYDLQQAHRCEDRIGVQKHRSQPASEPRGAGLLVNQGMRADARTLEVEMLAERKGFEPSMGFWPILP